VKQVAIESANDWRPIEIEEPTDRQIMKTTCAGRRTTSSAQSWHQSGGEALVSMVQATDLWNEQGRTGFDHCSSLNRLPFIRPSPLRDGLYLKSAGR
jgi:hypothetical protein